MKIYLATQIIINDGQDRALSAMNKRERLLSYYHSKEKECDLERYVKTGRNDKK